MATMRPKPVSQSQWIFPASSLSQTPSVRAGMSFDEELSRRKEAITILRSLAYRTQLVRQDNKNAPAAKGIMLVGATLIHRFYMRRSIQDFPPPLIGATVFFLTSKIEEEPVKLRYIVNACLSKFERIEDPRYHWDPHTRPDVGPSEKYTKWENNILACEELVLEALCFDMAVPQPWVILQSSLRGVEELLLDSASTSVFGSPDVLGEIGWTLLNEISMTPLMVLFYPEVIAFAVLILMVARLENLPLSEAKRTSAEIGWKFGLDIALDDNDEVVGQDLSAVDDCLAKIEEYCRLDLLERELVSLLPPEPAMRDSAYHRRFKPNPHPTSHPTQRNGHHPSTEGAVEIPPEEPVVGTEAPAEQVAGEKAGSISPPRY